METLFNKREEFDVYAGSVITGCICEAINRIKNKANDVNCIKFKHNEIEITVKKVE